MIIESSLYQVPSLLSPGIYLQEQQALPLPHFTHHVQDVLLRAMENVSALYNVTIIFSHISI